MKKVDKPKVQVGDICIFDKFNSLKNKKTIFGVFVVQAVRPLSHKRWACVDKYGAIFNIGEKHLYMIDLDHLSDIENLVIFRDPPSTPVFSREDIVALRNIQKYFKSNEESKYITKEDLIERLDSVCDKLTYYDNMKDV